MTAASRIVLFHKHASSARVRFLCFAGKSVCAPTPLPPSSTLSAVGAPVGGPVSVHPAVLLGAVQSDLGLEPGSIETVRDFSLWLDTPEGPAGVRLGVFTMLDPPFEAAREAGAAFIAITEARPLALVELEVLRHAYYHIMG